MASCIVVEFERHFLVQKLFNTTMVIDLPLVLVGSKGRNHIPRTIQTHFKCQKALGACGNFVWSQLNLIFLDQ